VCARACRLLSLSLSLSLFVCVDVGAGEDTVVCVDVWQPRA
jgi:hypothetical protein